jgi:hypothetical protein
MTPISSSVKTCRVAAGRRAISSSSAADGQPSAALIAVLRGQVGADERFESGPIGGLGVEAVALRAQLVGEDVRDQILLGREVAVEGAVGQAGVGHDGRNAGAVDAVCFEAPPGRFDDALPRRVLLVLAVSHTEPLSSYCSRSCRGTRSPTARPANGWPLLASSCCGRTMIL